MGVICFSSLKGGVGKTSVSVNVAHAFATTGCETLLIDLDPSRHASRLLAAGIVSAPDAALENERGIDSSDTTRHSPLPQLFLSQGFEAKFKERKSVVDVSHAFGIPLLTRVRPNLSVISGGPELRHFLWGNGVRLFARFFPALVRELLDSFDYIIVDTQPDFNVLTRTTISVADIVVALVDSSEMSIYCLEELVSGASHIDGPQWAILRTLVCKSASRVRSMAQTRLSQSIAMHHSGEHSNGSGFGRISSPHSEDEETHLDSRDSGYHEPSILGENGDTRFAEYLREGNGGYDTDLRYSRSSYEGWEEGFNSDGEGIDATIADPDQFIDLITRRATGGKQEPPSSIDPSSERFTLPQSSGRQGLAAHSKTLSSTRLPNGASAQAPNGPSAPSGKHKGGPIYLLDSMVYRTELQNRLSLSCQTAFDRGRDTDLSEQYRRVARELDLLIGIQQGISDDAEEAFMFSASP